MAPTAEVLALPELLEQIILQLPPRTILTKAQRVSKQWQYLVTTSPQIRHKLGMRSALTTLASPVRLVSGLTPTYAEEFSVGDWTDGSFSRSTGWKSREFLSIMLRTEPDTGCYYPRRAKFLEGYRKSATSAMASCPGPHAKTPKDSRGKTYREMLITRPACTVALITVTSSNTSPPGFMEAQATIRDAKGITFGLVEDMTTAMLKPVSDDERGVAYERFEFVHMCGEE